MTTHPFPLMMVLLTIRGCRPLSPPPGATGVPPRRPVLFTDDYNVYEDTTDPEVPSSETTAAWTFQKCNYKPCLEKQTPCETLAALYRCFCPGLTSPDDPPESPEKSSVSWNGSAVVVRWCAPKSPVTAYVVTVGGGEKQTLTEDKRSVALGRMDPGGEVCLVAVNRAGDSDPVCMKYQPSSCGLHLAAGLVGGSLGLLLLVLLVVLLCRRRRQKQRKARHV